MDSRYDGFVYIHCVAYLCTGVVLDQLKKLSSAVRRINWCKGHQCDSINMVIRLSNINYKTGKKFLWNIFFSFNHFWNLKKNPSLKGFFGSKWDLGIGYFQNLDNSSEILWVFLHFLGSFGEFLGNSWQILGEFFVEFVWNCQ